MPASKRAHTESIARAAINAERRTHLRLVEPRAIHWEIVDMFKAFSNYENMHVEESCDFL
jgi:uncharacterized SAM-dependent methyltransferase